MSYWDSILQDLKSSGLSMLDELFTTCISLCEKYTKEIAECVSRCHDRFNIAKTFSVEVT
mgnify:CR=1 FL=1